MAVNVVGIVGIAIFYLVILVIGLWAGRKRSQSTERPENEDSDESKEVMLAGRNIGMFVGAFTMTGKLFMANDLKQK